MKWTSIFSSEKKHLGTYTKTVFSDQKYKKVISLCKTNIYASAIWLRKALCLNMQLLKIMSDIQHNSHLFATSTQKHLSESSNVRLLHEADYMMTKVDPADYPHIIKESSEIFTDLRQ